MIASSIFYYMFTLRKSIAFKTRSPKLITVSILLLTLDAIGNTILYSNNSDESKWNKKCDIEIFVCQCCYLGVAIIYFIRMYRIFRVYKSYNNYLAQQV